jgi:hypothetical protein
LDGLDRFFSIGPYYGEILMKKLMGLFTVLWIGGLVSPVFADSSRGSRYNPYNPNRSEGGQEKLPIMERDFLGSDKGDDPFATEPRRWYDSQENYQKSYEQNVDDPRTLTNPYRGVRPSSPGELTNPYEGVIPQDPNRSPSNQQLTPPAQK